MTNHSQLLLDSFLENGYLVLVLWFIGALIIDIFILKAQIFSLLQTTTLAIWPKEILETHQNSKARSKQNKKTLTSDIKTRTRSSIIQDYHWFI